MVFDKYDWDRSYYYNAKAQIYSEYNRGAFNANRLIANYPAAHAETASTFWGFTSYSLGLFNNRIISGKEYADFSKTSAKYDKWVSSGTNVPFNDCYNLVVPPVKKLLLNQLVINNTVDVLVNNVITTQPAFFFVGTVSSPYEGMHTVEYIRNSETPIDEVISVSIPGVKGMSIVPGDAYDIFGNVSLVVNIFSSVAYINNGGTVTTFNHNIDIGVPPKLDDRPEVGFLVDLVPGSTTTISLMPSISLKSFIETNKIPFDGLIRIQKYPYTSDPTYYTLDEVIAFITSAKDKLYAMPTDGYLSVQTGLVYIDDGSLSSSKTVNNGYSVNLISLNSGTSVTRFSVINDIIAASNTPEDSYDLVVPAIQVSRTVTASSIGSSVVAFDSMPNYTYVDKPLYTVVDESSTGIYYGTDVTNIRYAEATTDSDGEVIGISSRDSSLDYTAAGITITSDINTMDALKQILELLVSDSGMLNNNKYGTANKFTISKDTLIVFIEYLLKYALDIKLAKEAALVDIGKNSAVGKLLKDAGYLESILGYKNVGNLDSMHLSFRIQLMTGINIFNDNDAYDNRNDVLKLFRDLPKAWDYVYVMYNDNGAPIAILPNWHKIKYGNRRIAAALLSAMIMVESQTKVYKPGLWIKIRKPLVGLIIAVLATFACGGNFLCGVAAWTSVVASAASVIASATGLKDWANAARLLGYVSMFISVSGVVKGITKKVFMNMLMSALPGMALKVIGYVRTKNFVSRMDDIAFKSDSLSAEVEGVEQLETALDTRDRVEKFIRGGFIDDNNTTLYRYNWDYKYI